MKQTIYCLLLSCVILALYPFHADLIWVPARNFETSFQELANKKLAPKFRLQFDLGDFAVNDIDSAKINNPLRILELLRESGVFQRKSSVKNPYFKVKLALNQQDFTSELTYNQFQANMPAQLAVNLLVTQGLLIP